MKPAGKDTLVETKAKILAVDDNPANLAIMREMVAGEHLLMTAESGEAALKIAYEFRPDITLLDIMMPGLDGYEVCRRMRADPRLAANKIIMVSAKALVSERLEGYAAGADDYVTKPFEEEELLAKIRVFLRLKTATEMDHLQSGMKSLLGPEMNARLSGIILPSSILMSDTDLEGIERKMLAEMVYRNVTRFKELLDRILNLQAPDTDD